MNMKKVIKISVCVIVILMICLSVVACGTTGEKVDYANIESIRVDESLKSESFKGFPISDFDISSIKLIIKYKDTVDADGNEVIGEEITIPATLAMVKAEDKEKLTMVGTNNITLIYGKFEVTFPLKLYDNVINLLNVNFYDEDGITRIGKTQQINYGDRAMQPNLPIKEGKVFVGWKDAQTGKFTTLDNITKNTDFIAYYESTTKVIGYYTDCEGDVKLIEEVSVDRGENGENYFPEAQIIEGFEFSGWTKISDDKYYAKYQKLKYSIKFIYRKYSEDIDNGKYEDSFNEYEIKVSGDTKVINEPTDAKCQGISIANDYHFAYWYTLHGNEKKIIEFPYTVNEIYEMTFYAEYTDINKGTPELKYKETSEGQCVISEYVGNGGLIVIPEYSPQGYKVTGINDGIFKEVAVTEFVVSSNNEYFTIGKDINGAYDGVLYSTGAKVLYAYPIKSSRGSYNIMNTTEEISSYAFFGAQNLHTIKMNDNLKTIGDYAFSDCCLLNKIIIPASVTDIDECAFKMNSENAVSELIFNGSGIKVFKDEVFYGLNKVKVLNFPASIESIGDGVFYGWGALEEIKILSSNYFRVQDGALYDYNYEKLYLYPSRYKNGTNPEFIVNQNCLSIERGAFFNAGITCLTIQSDLEFSNSSVICPGLKAIRIDTIAFSQDIGKFAMGFSNSVENIYVTQGNGVINANSFTTTKFADSNLIFYNEWETYADYYLDYILEYQENGILIKGYRGTDSYINIPYMIDGKPIIGICDNAFNGNKTIVQVTIPMGTEFIGARAFYACSMLTEVSLSSTVTMIGDYAFADCYSLNTFNINPGHIIEKFGHHVFAETPILQRSNEFVVIAGVLVVYNGSSQIVKIPNDIYYIATDAFRDKSTMLEIQFEENSNLKVIDEYAFFNCTGLSTITFPASVRKVNNYAFYGCDYLFYIKFNTLKSVVTIEADAYYMAGNYYALTTLNVQFIDTQTYKLIYHVGDSEVVTVEGIVFMTPYEPELSSDQLFLGWYKNIESDNDDAQLTESVQFPLSITEDTDIYLDVKDTKYVSSGIEYKKNENGEYIIIGYHGEDDKVVLPITYQDIPVVGFAENAFSRNQKDIIDVIIPNRLLNDKYVSYITSVGYNAFTDTTWYENIAGDFVVYDNLLIGYKGNAKKVVVPDGVTIIAEGAFKNNKTIEEIVLPKGIETITTELFSGCTALKKIILPNTVIEIKESAFDGCKNLEQINFNELTALTIIAYNAFDNTRWIADYEEDCVIINGILYKYNGTSSELHIPSSVTSIASGAFDGNTKIKVLHIPTSLTTIRERAFANMISLNAVYLPSSGAQLTYMMEGAFENCYNLSSFDFTYASMLSEISTKAFYNCAALEELTIPSGLIVLGDSAFMNTGIRRVEFSKDSRLIEIGDNVFNGCRSLYSVKFIGTSQLNLIGKSAFRDCIALREFINPTAIISTISDGSFYNCQSLTDFQINEASINELGKEAIYRLGYIVANNSNMLILGNILVSYKGTDKIVTIPENITLIYDSAFEGNTNVVEIKFKSDLYLRKINDRAFYGCKNLLTIVFPSSLTIIGYQVMDGTAWYNEQLETQDYITINNTLVKYNIQETRQAVIPEKVSVINRGAFYGMSVYDIKIHSGVTKIIDGAFDGIIPANWVEGTTNMYGYTMTLDNSIPPQLEYEVEFENCIAIYVNDFETLSKFKLNQEWEIQADDLVVIEKHTINYNIIANEGAPILAEDVHALYNGKDVTVYVTTDKQYVFVGWFLDADYTNAVSYPYILTKDTTIYAKCVDYDEGSNPKDYELEECGDESPGSYTITGYLDRTDKKVVIITQQSDKPIYSISGYLGYIEYSGDGEKYVFNQENGLFEEFDQYKIYPEETKTYRKNTVIEELSFANNCTIEVLGDYCFAGMSNLRKITLPASIKYISQNAFAGCENLKEIVFDSEMKDVVIETRAFLNCKNLETITIPESVIRLDNAAFEGCEKLKDVYLEAVTPIVLDSNQKPFDSSVPGFTIYIPNGAYTKYSSSWQAYERFLVELDVDGSKQ